MSVGFVGFVGVVVLAFVAVSLYGRERPAPPGEPRDEEGEA
jgi:hypothetical protein